MSTRTRGCIFRAGGILARHVVHIHIVLVGVRRTEAWLHLRKRNVHGNYTSGLENSHVIASHDVASLLNEGACGASRHPDVTLVEGLSRNGVLHVEAEPPVRVYVGIRNQPLSIRQGWRQDWSDAGSHWCWIGRRRSVGVAPVGTRGRQDGERDERDDDERATCYHGALSFCPHARYVRTFFERVNTCRASLKNNKERPTRIHPAQFLLITNNNSFTRDYTTKCTHLASKVCISCGKVLGPIYA